jgi:hypothetical protein
LDNYKYAFFPIFAGSLDYPEQMGVVWQNEGLLTGKWDEIGYEGRAYGRSNRSYYYSWRGYAGFLTTREAEDFKKILMDYDWNKFNDFAETKGEGSCVRSASLGFCKTLSRYEKSGPYIRKKVPELYQNLITLMATEKEKEFVKIHHPDLLKKPSQPSLACSEKQVATCLVKTWGPDLCGILAENRINASLDKKAYDFISSPICGKVISEALGVEFTSSDLEFSLTTGGLDDLGSYWLNDDDPDTDLLGIAAKGISIGYKLRAYNQCTQSCN